MICGPFMMIGPVVLLAGALFEKFSTCGFMAAAEVGARFNVRPTPVPLAAKPRSAWLRTCAVEPIG